MVRFVAHVAEIGRATAPEGCDVDAEHPVHGAKVLAVTAGPEAAAAVRHQHERWDGSGMPDRLSGNAIPAPARIAAIALALVKESYEIANVKAGAGSRFDPSMVEVVEEAVRDGVFGRTAP
jgi:response regulator RpfG family c-di-GMP phosphodiesterase